MRLCILDVILFRWLVLVSSVFIISALIHVLVIDLTCRVDASSVRSFPVQTADLLTSPCRSFDPGA